MSSAEIQEPFDWRSIAPTLRVMVTADQYAQVMADDPERAADWARNGAIGGDPQTRLIWGHMLLTGHGVAKDAEAALRWFKLAARAGNIEATNMVGRCYELGLGTPADSMEAVYWYRIAADDSDPWGCFNLACLMLQEAASPAVVNEALALLVRSARRGNPKSMTTIGQSLEQGWRGPIKVTAARRWYLRAARRGCFRGQFHIARWLLEDGDIDAAIMWFEKVTAIAPAGFSHELTHLLSGHSDQRVRKLAQSIRERGAVPS